MPGDPDRQHSHKSCSSPVNPPNNCPCPSYPPPSPRWHACACSLPSVACCPLPVWSTLFQLFPSFSALPVWSCFEEGSLCRNLLESCCEVDYVHARHSFGGAWGLNYEGQVVYSVAVIGPCRFRSGVFTHPCSHLKAPHASQILHPTFLVVVTP